MSDPNRRINWLRGNKILIYILAGAAAGGVNGLLGTGGGMVLVPAFTRLAKMEQKTALATSVAVITPLCILSAAVYWLRGGLAFEAALPFLAGGLLGGILGGRLFARVPAGLLRRIFALFILYGGIRCFL